MSSKLSVLWCRYFLVMLQMHHRFVISREFFLTTVNGFHQSLYHCTFKIENLCTMQSLREKGPYSEFFWLVFSRIRTRKTPNTDTFYTVNALHKILENKKAFSTSKRSNSGILEQKVVRCDKKSSCSTACRTFRKAGNKPGQKPFLLVSFSRTTVYNSTK